MFWAIIGRIDYKLNANSCFKVVLTLTGETPRGIVFFIRNYIRFKSTESSVEDKELCVSSCLYLFGHGICQFGGCQESLGTSSSPCKVPLPLALLPQSIGNPTYKHHSPSRYSVTCAQQLLWSCTGCSNNRWTKAKCFFENLATKVRIKQAFYSDYQE